MQADSELTKILNRTIFKLKEVLTLTEAARVCSEEGFSERAMSIVFDTEEPMRNAKRMFQAALVLRRTHPGREV